MIWAPQRVVLLPNSSWLQCLISSTQPAICCSSPTCGLSGMCSVLWPVFPGCMCTVSQGSTVALSKVTWLLKISVCWIWKMKHSKCTQHSTPESTSVFLIAISVSSACERLNSLRKVFMSDTTYFHAAYSYSLSVSIYYLLSSHFNIFPWICSFFNLL